MDLRVFILEHFCADAVEHAIFTFTQGGRMKSLLVRCFHVAASGFYCEQVNIFFYKRMEYSHGIASAACARHDRIREPAFLFQYLQSCLFSDDALEITHHSWERMRPDNRAYHIMSCLDVCHPVAHGFIDGVF